jgi:hypothetical protein
MAGLGRPVVLDEGDRGPGAHGELANKPVVGAGIAQDPAASVNVEDHRQDGRRVGRLHDPHPHIADFGRDRNPLLCDLELIDRRGLDVVEHLARAFRTELVEKRRRRGQVGDLLGFGFEDRLCRYHGFLPLVVGQVWSVWACSDRTVPSK